MASCTIYKSKSFGPRWSGTKELAAYFETTDGAGLGNEQIGAGGGSTYSILIDPYASVKTQSADADTDTIILDMNKYKNMSIYIANTDTGQTLTGQIWSCPPQPTVALRDAAAAAITTATTLRLDAAATVAEYGWVQEGSNITIANGTCDVSKLTATGGMIAVAVASDGALVDDGDGTDKCKVYVVGEFA
jgi:hypothetical protein|tara:strand:+ start:225 stop:794 length:570 start_codon:yes stop_codon:yes gene_type:complete